VGDAHAAGPLEQPKSASEAIKNEKGDADSHELDHVQDASHIEAQFETQTELFEQGGTIVNQLIFLLLPTVSFKLRSSAPGVGLTALTPQNCWKKAIPIPT